MGGTARHIARMTFFACVACMLFLVCPAIARADDASCRIRFFQQYKVDVSGLPNTFDYRITPEDALAVRPIDEGGNLIETFSLRRDQEIWLTFTFDGGALTKTGTSVFRFKAEPVTRELSDGLYYVDVLSTSLVAGVNVYYLEIYVTVAADGTIEEVVPTVHVQSWDGPKTSDPGWRIEWDEELYALFNGNAYGSSLGYLPGYGVPGALGNRGGYGYVSRGSNASGQGGPAGTSDGTGPSGTASGSNAAASSGGGSSAAGAGANAGSAASGSAAAHAAGGADSVNGAAGQAGFGATGAGAAGAAGGITDGAAGATAGTNVVGDRGASDGLATTGDVTSAVLPLALSAMLLISAGLTRHAHGKGEDR